MIFEVNHDHFSLYGNYIASFRSRSTNQKLLFHANLYCFWYFDWKITCG